MTTHHARPPWPSPPGRASPPTERTRSSPRPWASLAAVVIAVLWTIPTLGPVHLLVPARGATSRAAGGGPSSADPSVTLDNYRAVLTGSDTDLATYFVNSIVITIPSVLIPITLASMAAYAFAWMKFPGRNFLFVAVFAHADRADPGDDDPAALALRDAAVRAAVAGGLRGPGGGFYTIWLSHTIFALPLAIYLLHNFMREIPGELVESARVDGAGHVQIFTRIMLPLMMPAIAAFGIFQFLWVWNDLLVALVFGGGNLDVSPLTVRLAELSGTRGADWHLLSAGAFISLVVPLIVFLSLQRFFLRGLLAGSVKG